ncbi:dihydropteroate synthase [Wohlfahrtiimonas larvae]|uniref:Dihydropteroate synthase n=1 Tax=Wohlfahrtiimonas larvae TaxID=1157986 RepID=A0ABP9MIC1_9GAMM|nr:dihydropteroate synthase [Wohlfahrtiimonas larvae]
MNKLTLQQLLIKDAPIIMGILNATPNSFSDGGDFFDPTIAIKHAHQMVQEGATIIDIGAESSNPKASPITAEEEIARLIPVVKPLIHDLPALISIDTYHPETMKVMVELGVDIINDINGFRNPKSIDAVKNSNVSLVVMHLDNPIENMHTETKHDDITHSIGQFFLDQVEHLSDHNIHPDRILLDPGFGFGKTTEEQIELLQQLERLTALPYPIFIGLSRKRLIGHLTHVDVAKERTIGNVASALWCLQKGAKIFRVHDVKATHEAFQLWQQLSI